MQKTVAQLLGEKGRDVWTVTPTETVYKALEIMANKGVGALVVTDEKGLAGIISERDYARKVILLDRGSRDTLVKEIMTSEVKCVDPSQTTGECMTLMTEHRIRHLPVLEDGRLVGIVSIGDVVRAVISEQQFLIQQLEQYITS